MVLPTVHNSRNPQIPQPVNGTREAQPTDRARLQSSLLIAKPPIGTFRRNVSGLHLFVARAAKRPLVAKGHRLLNWFAYLLGERPHRPHRPLPGQRKVRSGDRRLEDLMTAPGETLILDGPAWNDTLRQRGERAKGEAAPVRWNGMLDLLCSGRIMPASVGRPWSRGIHLSAHLFRTTILAALMKRPLVYLSWGVDHHRGLRRRVARMIMRRADVVLVNDERTASEVRRLAGVEPRKVPYLVDVEFYACPPAGEREDFLFCPGENDRDGEALLALAERGHRVVWLNNVPELAARFAGRAEKLELVAALSFSELRDLYRRCRAVVAPMARDIHAAGQTTTLEALASGCTVVIGAGRTAELFASDGLVTVVPTNDPVAWEAAVERAVAADSAHPEAPAARAALIARRHGVAAVSAVLREVFGSLAKDRPTGIATQTGRRGSPTR